VLYASKSSKTLDEHACLQQGVTHPAQPRALAPVLCTTRAKQCWYGSRHLQPPLDGAAHKAFQKLSAAGSQQVCGVFTPNDLNQAKHQQGFASRLVKNVPLQHTPPQGALLRCAMLCCAALCSLAFHSSNFPFFALTGQQRYVQLPLWITSSLRKASPMTRCCCCPRQACP
jgi:hypothetical protein